MVLDEDIFMRSGLPKYSNVKILEGPYGHPYSGRPILPDASESAKENAIEVCNQTNNADVVEVFENTKTITGFIK